MVGLKREDQNEKGGWGRKIRDLPDVPHIPVIVFLLGLLSIAILLWSARINEKQRLNFALANAIMDAQIKLANFHLEMEEAIYGDRPKNVEKVFDELSLVNCLIEAVLNGGETEYGLILEPLTDSELRPLAEDIKSLLLRFEESARLRYQRATAGIEALDTGQSFHAFFTEIMQRASSLEQAAEKGQMIDEAKSKRIFFGFFFLWAIVVIGATAGLWNREARRKAAAVALHKANDELQSQAARLREHEEHLTDLVEERTAELAQANRHLRQEIMERQQAEVSLRESEGKCRILVDYLPQKIYLKDLSSVYIYCNNDFARDLGMQPDDITGKTDYDLFPTDIAEKNIAEDRQIIESGKPLEAEERYVKEGQEVVIRRFKMAARHGRNETGGILGILWDVTELVRLEAVAEAAAMMNNIGYVFQGVGHEIGNPINSAKMTLTVLKKRITTYSQETIEEYLERALGEISKVEYLLRTLKSFNMYETAELRNVELRPFMDKFLLLLADDFVKKGITIELIFGSEGLWGYVDPRALQQVLLNVMNNAADAVEGMKNPVIVIQLLKVSNAIRIRVKDNGRGISEEQQKRLFTPFFTTKSSGTGLGLVIVKKWLSRMGGGIEIKSQRDEGTIVEISIQEGKNEH